MSATLKWGLHPCKTDKIIYVLCVSGSLVLDLV